MKFTVYRTSQRRDDVPPCPQTHRETLTFTFANGTTKPMDEWVMELESLEALVAFTDAIGDNIIVSGVGPTGVPSIEIYDAYRE